MAQIRWYLNNTTVDGWQLLDQTAATAATLPNGWVVGTGSTNSSEFASGAAGDRASTTFTANTVPDGTLDTTLKDAMRSQNASTGNFAAGNWTFQFAVVGTVQSGAADGQIVFRILKADANGANATEITSAQQATTIATNVAGTDVNISATWAAPAWSITNQYIFVQLAWKRTGAGGMTTTNIRLRTGSSTTVGTTGLTADYTAEVTLATIASTAVIVGRGPTVANTQVVTGVTITSGSAVNTGHAIAPVISGQTIPSTARIFYTETLLLEQAAGSGSLFHYAAGRNYSQTISGHAEVLTSASLYVWKHGTPVDAIYLELRESTQNGTLLARSIEQPCSSVTGTTSAEAIWLNFPFLMPPVLSAGTTYWLEMYATRVVDDVSNRLNLLFISTDPYAGGEAKSAVGDQAGAGWDFKFRLYTGTSHTVAIEVPADQGVTGVTLASAASVTVPTVVPASAIGGATIRRVLLTDAFDYSNGVLPTVSGGLYAKPSLWPGQVLVESSLARGELGDDNAAYLTAGYSGSTVAQWAAVTFDTFNSYAGPTVFNNGVRDFYFADCRSSEVELYRVKNGSFNSLLLQAVTFGVGVVARLDVVLDGSGNPVLTLFKNGSVVVSVTDSHADKLTSGVPGLRIWHTVTRLSSFETGDFGGGAVAFAPTVAAPADQGVTGAYVPPSGVFVHDSFSGTAAFANLTTHAGEVGATWTKHPDFTTGNMVFTAGGAIRIDASILAVYYAGGVPSSAEYDIEWDFIVGASNDVVTGVCARLDTAASTYYLARWDYRVNQLHLVKYVAGVETVLDTYAITFTAATTYQMRFEVRDSAKRVYLNDVLRLTSTDNTITAAGRVGVSGQLGYSGGDNGVYLDDLVVRDVAFGVFAPTVYVPAAGTTVLRRRVFPHFVRDVYRRTFTLRYRSVILTVAAGEPPPPATQTIVAATIGGPVGDLVLEDSSGVLLEDGSALLLEGYTGAAQTFAPTVDQLTLDQGVTTVRITQSSLLWAPSVVNALLSGLVAYYPLNESSGNALDAYRTKDVGAINNPLAATGKQAGARDFNPATPQYFYLPSDTAFSFPSGDFTIQAWVKPEALAGMTSGGVVGYMKGDQQGDWWVSVDLYGRVIFGYFAVSGNNVGGQRYTTATVLADGTWAHIVCRKSGSSFTIWVDGSLRSLSQTDTSTGWFNNSFTIAEHYPTLAYRFNGLIDEVAVWGVAQSDAVVSWLHNNGAGRSYAEIVQLGGTQFLYPPQIAPTRVLSAPSITVGPVTVVGATIAPTSQTFIPSVATGPVTVTGATRLSTAQLFVPSIATGPVGITGATRASTSIINVPSIAVGPVAVTGATRASTSAVTAPSVALTTTGATIASTSGLFPPQMVTQTVTTLVRLTTALLFTATVGLPIALVTTNTVASASQINVPSVAVGPVTVTGDTRLSTAQVFVPAISTGVAVVDGVTISTTVVLRTATITTGPIGITASTVTGSSQTFVPSIAVGAVTVTGVHRTTTIVLFAPALTVQTTGATIVSGSGTFPPSVALTVTTGPRPATSAVFAATVALSVTTATLASAVIVRVPTVLPQPVAVGGSTIAATSLVRVPSIAVGPFTIVGGTVSTTAVLFVPALTQVDAGAIGAQTISTGAVLNPPSVVGGLAIIGVPFIAATSTVHAPSVTVGAVVVVAGTIPATSQVFALTLTTQTVTVTGPTRPSTAQVFAPVLTAISTGATIVSGSGTFAPTVALTVTTAHRATTSQTFAPTLAVGPVAVTGATRAATSLIFIPTVAVGPVTILAPTRASASLIFAPSLTTLTVITTTPIASTASLFPPTVLPLDAIGGPTTGSTVQLFGVTITTGPVAVTGGTRPSTLQIFIPTIAVGVTSVTGGTVGTTALLFAPTTIARLDGTFIASTAGLFPPTVKLTQFVTTAPILTGAAPFAPSVLAVWAVTGGTRLSTTQTFAPSITTGAIGVIGSTVPATVLVTAPAVGVGAVTVTVPHRASTLLVRVPTVSYVVEGAHRTSAVALFPPALATGPVAVSTGAIVTTVQVFPPSLGVGITTATLVSASLPFAPTLAPHVTTPLWIIRTQLFPPSAIPLGEMILTFLPSGSVVFPPFMVGYAPPPEILDFTSNLVREAEGTVIVCRSMEGTVILTRDVTIVATVDRELDIAASIVLRDVEIEVER